MSQIDAYEVNDRLEPTSEKFGALEHLVDMAAFEAARSDIEVSDMLSALAQAVHDDDLDAFKAKWLRAEAAAGVEAAQAEGDLD